MEFEIKFSSSDNKSITIDIYNTERIMEKRTLWISRFSFLSKDQKL